MELREADNGCLQWNALGEGGQQTDVLDVAVQ